MAEKARGQCVVSAFTSPIESFAVQKWMRDRKLVAASRPSAAAANVAHSDDLRLIFDHLDPRRTGKMHLRTLRNALAAMGDLSEDRARHKTLLETIVGCFGASSRFKHTGVDFNQFATIMLSQVKRSRKFLTLQEELKSGDLANALNLFVSRFRRDIFMRELLNEDRTDTLVCATFKDLFKTEELDETSGGGPHWAQLQEIVLNKRRMKKLECRRAAMALQRVLETRRSFTRRCPGLRRIHAVQPAVIPPSFISRLCGCYIFPSRDSPSGARGCPRSDDLMEEHGSDCVQRGIVSEQGFRQRWGRRARSPPAQEASCGSPEEHVCLKREAVRQASEVVGLRYIPTPPRYVQTTRLPRAFHGRYRSGGGFVRCPSPRMLRFGHQLRRRVPTKLGRSAEASAKLPRWALRHESGDGGPCTLTTGRQCPAAQGNVHVNAPSPASRAATSARKPDAIGGDRRPRPQRTGSVKTSAPGTPIFRPGVAQEERCCLQARPDADARREAQPTASPKGATAAVKSALPHVITHTAIFPRAGLIDSRKPLPTDHDISPAEGNRGKSAPQAAAFASRRSQAPRGSQDRAGGRRKIGCGKLGFTAEPAPTPWRSPRVVKRKRRPGQGQRHLKNGGAPTVRDVGGGGDKFCTEIAP